MKTLVCSIAIASACFGSYAKDDVVFRQDTAYGGVPYEALITSDQLKKTPEWKEEDGCPPLVPRRAESYALDYVRQRWQPGEWKIEQICLVPADFEGRWLYIVKLRPPLARGVSGGFFAPVDIVVLMDGHVVSPERIAAQGT